MSWMIPRHFVSGLVPLLSTCCQFAVTQMGARWTIVVWKIKDDAISNLSQVIAQLSRLGVMLDWCWIDWSQSTNLLRSAYDSEIEFYSYTAAALLCRFIHFVLCYSSYYSYVTTNRDNLTAILPTYHSFLLCHWLVKLRTARLLHISYYSDVPSIRRPKGRANATSRSSGPQLSLRLRALHGSVPFPCRCKPEKIFRVQFMPTTFSSSFSRSSSSISMN